jgi:type IV pilus assembly protein PilZ
MATGVRQGMLSVSIPDKASLYKSYMGFLKNGGLFVPTTKPYRLGEEVFVLLNLPEESERRPVPGKVAWIAQSNQAMGRPQGVGVQFIDTAENDSLRSRIEVLLAGMPTDKLTHTM